MKKLNFSIALDAKPEQIWAALWGDAGYRAWAAIFFAGSYMVVDSWDEGETVMFLGPDESGIYSRIESHIPNQLIAFRHIGNVLKSVAQPLDTESKKWTGATEIYSIVEGRHSLKLMIDIDVMDEHVEFMKEKFPLALEIIRQNSTS